MFAELKSQLTSLLDQGRLDDALAHWRTASDGDGLRADGARWLAQMLLARGEAARSDALLAELAVERPNLPWLLQLRSQAAHAMGNREARMVHLRRLFELSPESPAGAAALLSALLDAGLTESATQVSLEHAAHVCHAMQRLAAWREPALAADEDPVARARCLYLDLLERTVSNWVYADPSNRQGELTPFDPTRRTLGKDIPSMGHTMIGLTRLRHLRVLTEALITEKIPGDFVEAGVWRGGACILMAGVIRAHDVSDRLVVAADSYAGLPPPDPRYAKDALTTFNFHLREELAVSVDAVRSNFERYGLWSDRVVLLEGLFCDTLPKYPHGPIALLRMDGDLYSSTMDTLVHLYDRVSPGGYVISDDYGVVIDARRAVLDFRAQRGITAELIRVDQDAVFWRKPR